MVHFIMKTLISKIKVVVIYEKYCVYYPILLPECDTWVVFKWNKVGLNSDFFFS